MTTRLDSLLKEAARYLSNGSDPFSGDFLRKHDVSLDEAYDMGDTIALAINMWVLMTPTQKGVAIGILAANGVITS